MIESKNRAVFFRWDDKLKHLDGTKHFKHVWWFLRHAKQKHVIYFTSLVSFPAQKMMINVL